jgi:hypothetical protein
VQTKCDHSTMPTNLQRFLFVLAIALLIVPATAHATSLSKPPNNLGLVGYWSFNEGTGTKAGDMSGNGNTGTLTNGPTWAGGKLGGALRFDGLDDYIDAGDSSALEPASTITVSVWVNVRGAGTWSGQDNGNDYLFTKGRNSGSPPYYSYGLSWRASDNRFLFAIGTSGTHTSITGSVSHPAGSGWMHVVGVYDGTNVYLFVNGVQEATTALSGAIAYGFASDNLYLGLWQTSSYIRAINGVLDDVRIYNRALGANEITRLYQSGAAKLQGASSEVGTGLVGHWKFDDAQGTAAVDSSGRGSNGTLTSGPRWTTGRRGGGLSFDATDDYVALPSGQGFSSTQDHSYAAWVNPTSLPGTYTWLIDYGNGGATQGSSLIIYSATDVTGFFYAGGNAFVTGTRVIPTNQWSHIVASYSAATQKVTFYVNGVLDTQSAALSSWTSSSSVHSIGQWFNGAYRFGGSMDDVRVYNRALTADQVRALYSSGTAHPVVRNQSSSKLTANTSLASGLVGHWTFDGADLTGSGGVGTARDVSGSNNHGTLTNGPTRALGKLGQALNFVRASSQYVSIPIGSSLAQQGEFSFAGWLKLNSDYTSAQVVISNGSAVTVNHQNYIVEFGQTDYKLSLWNSGAGPIASTATSIADNNWHHYAVVRTGASGNWTVRIYLDGVLDSTTSSIATNPSGAASDYSLIGGLSNAGSSYAGYLMNGVLDDVRIYNRALSATEVRSLYNLAR